MWSGIIGILAFIFVLGLIIVIHEAGHFFFARRAGVLCHEFSFGMGPVLWQTKRGETLYSIRAIPIGGYVMMAGEDEDTSMVKKGQEVRLLIENNIVTKIIVDLKNETYKHLEMVKVLDVDLYGKDGDLFILVDEEEPTKYIVQRDGMYVFRQNEMYFSPYERSIESKTKWERFLAIFGGPMMNFILAIVVFIVVGALTGAPQLDSTVLGEVLDDGPAHNAGIRPGDEIVSINGVEVDNWEEISRELDKDISGDITISYNRAGGEIESTFGPRIIFYNAGFTSDHEVGEGLFVAGVSEDTVAGKAGMEVGDEIKSIDSVEVTTWDEIVSIMASNTAGNSMNFVVERSGELETFDILVYDEELVNSQGLEIVDNQIGIGAEYSFDLGYAIQSGFTGTVDSVKSVLSTIRLLISNDRVGVTDLAGPVGIYSMTSRIAQAGPISLLRWLGLLSVNVGLLNILPIPALDGGRLVFLGYEAITGKKVNRNIENRIHTMMYFALLALFAVVTWNDILRLIGLK